MAESHETTDPTHGERDSQQPPLPLGEASSSREKFEARLKALAKPLEAPDPPSEPAPIPLATTPAEQKPMPAPVPRPPAPAMATPAPPPAPAPMPPSAPNQWAQQTRKRGMGKDTKFGLLLVMALTIGFGYVVYKKVFDQGSTSAMAGDPPVQSEPEPKSAPEKKMGEGSPPKADPFGGAKEPELPPFPADPKPEPPAKKTDPKQPVEPPEKLGSAPPTFPELDGPKTPPEKSDGKKPASTKEEPKKEDPFGGVGGSLIPEPVSPTKEPESAPIPLEPAPLPTPPAGEPPSIPLEPPPSGGKKDPSPTPVFPELDPVTPKPMKGEPKKVEPPAFELIPPGEGKKKTAEGTNVVPASSTKKDEPKKDGPPDPFDPFAVPPPGKTEPPFGKDPEPKKPEPKVEPILPFDPDPKADPGKLPVKDPGKFPSIDPPAKPDPIIPDVNNIPGAKPLFPARGKTYTVRPDDSYWRISKNVYGTPIYFMALHLHNRDRIPDAKKLRPGTLVRTPSSTELRRLYPKLFQNVVPGGADPKIASGFFFDRSGKPAYRVGKTDTLTSIAHHHLGRASRWVQIYQMNRASIANPDKLRIGTVLRLPPDASRVSLIRKQPVFR